MEKMFRWNAKKKKKTFLIKTIKIQAEVLRQKNHNAETRYTTAVLKTLRLKSYKIPR